MKIVFKKIKVKNLIILFNLFIIISIFLISTFNFGNFILLSETKIVLKSILGADFFWLDYKVISILYSLTSTVSIIAFVGSKSFNNFNIKYQFYILFAVIGLNIFIIFYLLKIFTMSRLYLLFLLLVTPLIIFIYILISQKLKLINELFISIIGLFLLIIYFFTPSTLERNNPTSINLEETNINTNTLVMEYLLSPKIKILKYEVCCNEDSYFISGKKPFGYISKHEDSIIFISGKGELKVYKLINFTGYRELEERVINSNIKEVIKNEYVFLKDDESIKDMIIINNTIYVSYIEEISNNCVNVQVLEAEFNYDFLQFKNFFKSNECVEVFRDEEKTHISGGALLKADNENIYLTTGDFGDYSLAQDKGSIFGKILKINLTTKTYSIVSLGHRNPQGLNNFDLFGNLIETEHGPLGGDEINLINTLSIENFGWPISSYGVHYDGKYNAEAPLNKSHKDFDFKEPAFYIDVDNYGTHGISDVEKNYFDDGLSFFITSMQAQKLHVAVFDQISNQLIDLYSYNIGNRIRDIEFIPEHNIYIMVLENPQSLAVLMLNKQ